MYQIRQFLKKKWRRSDPARRMSLIVTLIIGTGCLLDANSASATDAVVSQMQVSPDQVKQYPVAQIFTFLLLMLGPFKIIGPFAKITRGAEAAFTYRIALLAIAFSSLALLIAAFLGERILRNYGIPIHVLALSAGIILFLVALKNVLQQFTVNDEDAAGRASKPTMKMALTPLAFPMIVTPLASLHWSYSSLSALTCRAS